MAISSQQSAISKMAIGFQQSAFSKEGLDKPNLSFLTAERFFRRKNRPDR